MTPARSGREVETATERPPGAEELHESNRRFRHLLSNVELVSLMLDRDARITYCNDYLLRLTGWRREEVLGQDWFELFVPPELDDLKGVFEALLADLPSAWHHENEILTRSGERRLIEWSNTALRSSSGDVIGTASIGVDITERKRTELRLLESEARYRQLIEQATGDLRADIQQRIKAFGDTAFEIICTRLFLENPYRRYAGRRKQKTDHQIGAVEISRPMAERAAQASIDMELQATAMISECLSPLLGGLTQAAPGAEAPNPRRYQNEEGSIQERLDHLAKGQPVSIVERRSDTEQHIAAWCRVAKERFRANPGLSAADIARYIAETWNPENNVVKKDGTPYKAGYLARIVRQALS